MSIFEQVPSMIPQIRGLMCKMIVNGLTVNFRNMLQTMADHINEQKSNTITDLEQLCTPELLGQIYLEALHEASDSNQISRAIIEGKDKAFIEQLKKNMDIARNRLRAITNVLQYDDGRFCRVPDLCIHRTETINGNRGYSIINVTTGDLKLHDDIANLLSVEEGYLYR